VNFLHHGESQLKVKVWFRSSHPDDATPHNIIHGVAAFRETSLGSPTKRVLIAFLWADSILAFGAHLKQLTDYIFEHRLAQEVLIDVDSRPNQEYKLNGEMVSKLKENGFRWKMVSQSDTGLERYTTFAIKHPDSKTAKMAETHCFSLDFSTIFSLSVGSVPELESVVFYRLSIAPRLSSSGLLPSGTAKLPETKSRNERIRQTGGHPTFQFKKIAQQNWQHRRKK
jgi:hypothetical protein